MNLNPKPLLLLGLGLGLGIGGTWALMRQPGAAATQASPQATPKPQPTIYQCPMHPEIIMDHEGDCPICGMKLVRMEGADGSPLMVDGRRAITIDAERQQLIGLKTVKAAEGPVGGELRTTVRLTVDETRVRKINVKVEGFVEKLFVDFTGKAVAKGQPLFSLYSPDFVSAQREYLLAARTQKALAEGSLTRSGSDLLDSARRRLALWDVPKEALDHLEQTGEVTRALTLRSPISGVVTLKNVVEGARLTPADIPFEITDLGQVWALADIFETELGKVRVGMAATMSLAAYPERTFAGRVAFVDPVLDPKSRTLKVRIEFPNPKGELKPELFGEVVLKGGGHRGILVPMDAVLDAGTQKVVFIALGSGKFAPREVTTGTAVGDQIELLSGVKVGEEIITRANFLVDSESRLKAALERLATKSATSAPPAASHAH